MSSERGAIVALLTDFGLRDHYVAAMKGVIASRSSATIVDLSHEIEPFDVFAAGYFLRSCAGYYEGGDDRRVVFVAVVDPGVGSDRRILAARSDGRFFVAPDNGLLSMVLADSAEVTAVEDESLFLPGRSRTFHGRDRFAPVAAAIAEGSDPSGFGPAVARDAIVSIGYQEPRYDPSECVGSVVAIDVFGNIVTDLEAAKIGDLARFELQVGDLRVRKSEPHYRSGSRVEPFMIVGSSDTIEVSLTERSAAHQVGVRRGDQVTLFPSRDPSDEEQGASPDDSL